MVAPLRVCCRRLGPFPLNRPGWVEDVVRPPVAGAELSPPGRKWRRAVVAVRCRVGLGRGGGFGGWLLLLLLLLLVMLWVVLLLVRLLRVCSEYVQRRVVGGAGTALGSCTYSRAGERNACARNGSSALGGQCLLC